MGNSCTRCWYNKVSHVEHGLVHVAGKWGLFVAKHPLLVMLCSLSCALLMGVGVIFIESETRTEELYAPKNSKSYDNKKRYDSSWGIYEDQIRPQQIYVTSKNNNNLKSQQNIFTAEYLSEFLKIHELISSLEVEKDGISYSFYDLCYEYQNGNCAINSILSFYDFNQTQIENTFNDTKILYPSQFSSYSDTDVTMVLILGQDITVDDNDEVIASPALSIAYFMDESLYGEDLIAEWEAKFLDFMTDFRSDMFDIVYQASYSFSLELSSAVGSDIPQFVISFNLIGVFAALVLIRVKRNDSESGCKYKLDPKRNRSHLSIMGTVSTLCAVVGCFGVVGGLFGVKFNSVVAIAPFLLVGLGVDDMFVLLRAYELTDPSKSVDERIKTTMERGGVSILFTSITDLVAFLVGSFSPFGSVSAFCLYSGVGVLLDFVFQVTFFLSTMVYASKPEHFLCCCCTCGNKVDDDDGSETNSKDSIEMTAAPSENVKELKVCDGGKENEVVDLNYTNVLLNYMIDPEAASVVMKKLGDLILESVLVKVTILIGVVLYLIGAAYGSLDIIALQDPSALVPGDSYLLKYFDLFETYFDQIGRPMTMVLDKPLDYSNQTIQNRLNEFVNELQNNKCFESEEYLTNFWLDSYRTYLDQNYGNSNNDSSLFYNVLYSEYLPSEQGEQYIDDIWNTIVVEDDALLTAATIGESSYQFINKSKLSISVSLKGTGTRPFADCLDDWQSIERKYEDLGVYYNLYINVVAEADLVTVQQTIQNLAYASAAALIISLILIPYPKMTIFVMTTVAQILFGVLGYMSLWGLPINTTTMINMVLSVGFSIDNAAHFCHAFTTAPIKDIPHKLTAKQERNARVLFALNSVGMPILAGDMSTIVALLPLAGSNSEIFISFWKCISLVMMFGAGYAVLYLPTVLSLIGPVGLDDVLNKEEENKKYLENQQELNETKETHNENDETEPIKEETAENEPKIQTATEEKKENKDELETEKEDVESSTHADVQTQR